MMGDANSILIIVIKPKFIRLETFYITYLKFVKFALSIKVQICKNGHNFEKSKI